MKLTALAVVLAASVIMAASAQGGGATGRVAAGGADTTPPAPFIRAAKRQDLDNVFQRGIQTTCGTENDERPVECAISANRRGRELAFAVDDIVAPFNRVHFDLKLDARDKRRIRRSEPPIEIRLRLAVTDEAGNVGRTQKTIRIVAGLFD